jgi:hypothetical protein
MVNGREIQYVDYYIISLVFCSFFSFYVSNHQFGLTSKVWHVRRHGTQEAAALFYLSVLTFLATHSNNQGPINHQKRFMPVRLLRGCHVRRLPTVMIGAHILVYLSPIFLFVTRCTVVVSLLQTKKEQWPSMHHPATNREASPVKGKEKEDISSNIYRPFTDYFLSSLHP